MRRKVCQLVAGIVIADDLLDDKEEAFVDRLLARFEVNDSGRDVIFPLVDRDEATLAIVALPKDVQQEAFSLLVEAACVDGKIEPEEHQYLKAVADVIGVTGETLEARIAAQMGRQ